MAVSTAASEAGVLAKPQQNRFASPGRLSSRMRSYSGCVAARAHSTKDITSPSLEHAGSCVKPGEAPAFEVEFTEAKSVISDVPGLVQLTLSGWVEQADLQPRLDVRVHSRRDRTGRQPKVISFFLRIQADGLLGCRGAYRLDPARAPLRSACSTPLPNGQPIESRCWSGGAAGFVVRHQSRWRCQFIPARGNTKLSNRSVSPTSAPRIRRA